MKSKYFVASDNQKFDDITFCREFRNSVSLVIKKYRLFSVRGRLLFLSALLHGVTDTGPDPRLASGTTTGWPVTPTRGLSTHPHPLWKWYGSSPIGRLLTIVWKTIVLNILLCIIFMIYCCRLGLALTIMSGVLPYNLDETRSSRSHSFCIS